MESKVEGSGMRESEIKESKTTESQIPNALNDPSASAAVAALQQRIAELEAQLHQTQAGMVQQLASQKPAAQEPLTEALLAEEALRESERRYRLLAENTSDVILTLDLNLRTTYVSPGIKSLSGYEVEEAVAQTLDTVLTPASLRAARRAFAAALALSRQPGKPPLGSRTLELEIVRKDGGTVWTETTITFLRDAQEQPTGLLATVRDISARKKTEAALRESEGRYRLLAENTSDIIWTIGMDQRFTYISPAVERMRGYTVREALVQPLRDAMTLDSRKRVNELLQEAAVLERTPGVNPFRSRTLELELIRKDGSTVWTETTITFLRNAEGKPVEVLGVTRDITARKQAAEALAESERRYRLLAEHATDVIWTMDMGLHFTYISPAARKLRGYEAHETFSQNLEDVLTPTSMEFALQALAEELAQDQQVERPSFSSRTLELELRRKDGSTVWSETIISFLRDEKGQPVEILGVTRDITARRQAEETRQRRLIYEQLLSRLSSMAVHVKDLPTFLDAATATMGQTLDVSRAYIFEHRHDTDTMDNTVEWCAPGIPPQHDQLQRIPSSSIPWWIQTLRAGLTIRFSDIEALPDTAARDMLRAQNVLSIWVVPLFVSGQYFGFMGFDESKYRREWPEEDTGLIISMSRIIASTVERLRAERDLRASEARYRSLIEQSTDAIYLLSGEHFEMVNPRFEQLLGVTAAEVCAPDFDFMSLVAPQSRDAVLERGRRIAAGQVVSPRYEFTALTRDGQELEVEVAVSYITYHDTVATQGILRDISARKQAERAQQLQLQRVQRQQATVVALSLHPAFINGDLPAAMSFLTETVAGTLDVARASVWLLENGGTALRCHDLYLRHEGAHRSGEVLAAADYPAYFAALAQGRTIDAANASSDPRTCEFAESYFKPAKSTSVLDAAFRSSGRLFGVISLEHSGERRPWHADEITFAGAVADQLAQAFANARRKQAEKQLQESEARFRALAENIPGAVYLQSHDRTPIYLNHTIETLTGYPREDFLDGRLRLADLLDAADGPRIANAVTDALARHTSFHLIYHLQRSDDTWRWVEEWGAGIYDGAQLIFVEGFLADITERRSLEMQLRRQEQLAAIGQLAAGIAHDFRNLLTTIILYAHLGQRQPNLPASLTRYLTTIAGEANKATDLVERILDFSRRTELDRQPLDLVAFVGEVITVLQHTLPESIHIAFEVEPGPHMVEGDAGRLQQAITNLALNARDAMPQGGDLRIGLTRIAAGPGIAPPLPAMADDLAPPAWIRLSVTDTGVGMPPEVQAQLFQPFFTTKEEGKGTGLGLAQVYGIIQLHAGYIDVSSVVNHGTTFHIYLPAVAKAAEVSLEDERQIPIGQGETLLFVEDNAHLREAGRSMLVDLGYHVLAAANGREALSLLQNELAAAPANGAANAPAPERAGQRPIATNLALLVTDLVMPEMGGKVLLQRLRETVPQLKALVMTGHSTAESVESLRAAGFLEVVRKPFDVDTLALAIHRALHDRP